MKYEKGDCLLLTDISKGEAVRYAIFDSFASRTLAGHDDIYYVRLLTGKNLVTIEKNEIIRKISEEEFNLVKIMLD